MRRLGLTHQPELTCREMEAQTGCSARISPQSARHSEQIRTPGRRGAWRWRPNFPTAGRSGARTRPGTSRRCLQQKLHVAPGSVSTASRVQRFERWTRSTRTSSARSTHRSQMNTRDRRSACGTVSGLAPQKLPARSDRHSLTAPFAGSDVNDLMEALVAEPECIGHLAKRSTRRVKLPDGVLVGNRGLVRLVLKVERAS